ncbi:retrovirus-related pol polyprotein from transposon TNT 1-94 [Tanacetum coccineum]
MAAVEVPQTLEYRGGQLNAAHVLEMITNWKKSPYIPMAAGQRKPKGQWTDFQDSPDDEDDTRSSHEYLNDLEEEYQAMTLLARSKRFFKKGTQRFSNAKATDQTECHKCGKKGHFARDCWSKTSVPSHQTPFQSKLLFSSENKPEPRQIKEFEAKYHKFKAKLALLSSSASTPSSSSGKNKGLIAKTYDRDDKEVSSVENEVTEVKALVESKIWTQLGYE